MARKNKSKHGGNPNRPRFWGKHAVAAALDNPDRRVLKAWSTREAAEYMNFPKDLPVVMAEAPDLGRMVPHDAPHQGIVAEVERLDDLLLADLLDQAGDGRPLLVLDQVTDPHNVGAILRSAAAFGAIGIVTQDRHAPPEGGALAKAASGALDRVPWVRVVNLARALEAALASAPDSGGACRSWVTMPSAPKAAAERRIAPTLWGSVTWSSTSKGRPSSA